MVRSCGLLRYFLLKRQKILSNLSMQVFIYKILNIDHGNNNKKKEKKRSETQ